MSKFKSGDKVKIVSLSNSSIGDAEYTIGDFATIVCLNDCFLNNDLWIKLENGSEYGISSEDVELIFETDEEEVEVNKFNPLASQSGGSHYKIHGVQPVEYTMSNNLSFCQGNIIKYITRYADKNGLEDLEKVIHYTLLEAYFKYGEDGSEELKQRVLKLFNK